MAVGEGGPDDHPPAAWRAFVQMDSAIGVKMMDVATDKPVLTSVTRWKEAAGRLWRYGGAQFTAYPAPGDNFEAGYSDNCSNELSTVLNTLRLQAEPCARLEGPLTLLSLGGGSGSGPGRRVVLAYKDAYPSSAAMAMTDVWPFSPGGTTVQAYNTVRGLSHLKEDSKAVLLLSNASLPQTAEKRQPLLTVALADINAARLPPNPRVYCGQART